MASVDVVIPCYQYGRFLPEAVISVLSQGVPDLRILIIDNASTDGSADVARKLAELQPEIHVSLHTVNQGSTASYNEGIDWARADYFLLLDADDMLAPGALRRALRIMEQNRKVAFTHGIEAHAVDGVVTPPPTVDDDDTGDGWQVTDGWKFIEQLCRTPVNIVGANTVIRRTSVQKAAGHYRETLPYTDDLEMWLRLATFGDVAVTPHVQAIRRIHAQQRSERYRNAQLLDFRERERAFFSFFEHEGGVHPGRRALEQQVRRELGKHAYWSALSHYFRGKKQVAAELMAFSRERRGRAGLLPPLDWLFRMNNPIGRVREVLQEAMLQRQRP